MADNSQSPGLVGRLAGITRLLELERAHFIFALIYFPVAWLFLGRGAVEQVLLLVYTAIMAVVGIMMLVKFAVYLAGEANQHSGMYGGVLINFLVDAVVPLLMFKVYGYVLWRMLPETCSGITYDLVRMFKDLYSILQYQNSLNTLIIFGLTLTFVFTLWSVAKRQ